MLSDIEREYLKRFYNVLRDNLRREKNLKGNSILTSFLETRSASRYKVLGASTLLSTSVPEDVLLSFLSQNYIQKIGGIDNYAITAKGVWHYELVLGLMNEDTLLTFINKKYFASNTSTSLDKKDLDDREKVILYTLIAARAFSQKSCADLKTKETVKDKWLELLERSYDCLVSLKVITKLSKSDFLSKTGNEHVASSIFRHNGHMLQKTSGIYSYTGKYQYFLEIYNDLVFSKEKLSYLFWKLFNGDISIYSIDLITDYCNKVSSNDSIYLFDMKEHIFSLPTYDSILKDCLLSSVVSKTKWEAIT
jgi:hypothetical protein